MMYAAVDIETKDPMLKVWGSGAIRGDGKILGVGIYCPDLGIDDYYNYDDPIVKKILGDENVCKIFHNGVYDTDWLVHWAGYEIKGRIEDTMTRETLLDSYADRYSLDTCCARHGVEGKNKGETIDEWYKRNIGKGKAIEHLDIIPFTVVGKYCKQDCHATYDLFMTQQPLLEQQGLLSANDIECRLYPFLIAMRGNGFGLNWKARAELSDQLTEQYDTMYKALCAEAGFEVNLNSATDLEKIWKMKGLPIEYTSTGRPSFAATVLADCPDPVAEQIRHMRGIEKLLNTFVDGGFVDQSFNGRLWSTFYPAKRDVSGGTVTGRWSSQNINLQNIPAREDKFGKEIRSLFVPDEGCVLGAYDYKQIEYRVFSHFAVASGVYGHESIVKGFAENPDMDYHQMTIDLMGWGDMGKGGRHLAKNLNFGSIYGLGYRSFAQKFKWNIIHAHPDADPDNLEPLAQSLMNEYYHKVPFVQPLCKKIQEIGTRRGYVTTLSGKRQRMPLDNGAYKLINYLVQGSAADIQKKGCVDAWEAGVFNVLKPHAVVHDENVFSAPVSKEGLEACKEFERCMANAYELKVPIGVDTEMGPDWGHCDMDGYKIYNAQCLNS